MITTGVRVSELVAIKISDVTLTTGAQHLRVHGKGRKNRTTPLKAETSTALRAWLHERAGAANDPLFPTRQGRQLHRQTVALLLTKHARAAAARCPSLAPKRVSPHTLRHTTAMLLQAERIDIATIALWLGHERSRPPTSTSTPTTSSNKRRSTAPPRSAPHPADISRPTASSPSSKDSDYAQQLATATISSADKTRAATAALTITERRA